MKVIELRTPLEHKIWASTYSAMFANMVIVEQRGRDLERAICEVSVHDCVCVANEAVELVREHIEESA